jgi:hypothetical protein
MIWSVLASCMTRPFIDVLHKPLIRRDTAGIVHRYGVVNLFTGLVTLSLVPLASIESTM